MTRTLRDVVETITSGVFYDDYDESVADCGILIKAVEDIDRMRTTLRSADAHLERLGYKPTSIAREAINRARTE